MIENIMISTEIANYEIEELRDWGIEGFRVLVVNFVHFVSKYFSIERSSYSKKCLKLQNA
jgi:hypothetical protein